MKRPFGSLLFAMGMAGIFNAISSPDHGHRIKHPFGKQTHECRSSSQRIRANRRKAARKH